MARHPHRTPPGTFKDHGYSKMKSEHDDGRYYDGKKSGGSCYLSADDDMYEDAFDGKLTATQLKK